jgi:hypothetical protein
MPLPVPYQCQLLFSCCPASANDCQRLSTAAIALPASQLPVQQLHSLVAASLSFLYCFRLFCFSSQPLLFFPQPHPQYHLLSTQLFTPQLFTNIKPYYLGIITSCYLHIAQAFGSELQQCKDQLRSRLPLVAVNGSQASSQRTAATMTSMSAHIHVSLTVTIRTFEPREYLADGILARSSQNEVKFQGLYQKATAELRSKYITRTLEITSGRHKDVELTNIPKPSSAAQSLTTPACMVSPTNPLVRLFI